MKRETDYFTSFCKISKAFGTAATKEELLSLIVDSAVTSMEGKAACLFLADEREDVFMAKAQAGLSDKYIHADPTRAHKCIAALDKDGYLAFSDATSDPRLENHEAKKAEGIASLLTVPVKIKNNNIGILSLYTAERREFQAKEIDFLCALADQAGIAIENNRLHRRMHKNAMLFLELASNINSSLDIHQVLNSLTADVCDKLGFKGAVIRLVDEDQNELKLVASYGLSEDFLKKGLKRSRNTTSVIAQRALKGETLVIRDTTTDSRITFKEAMKEEGILSMIIAPILVREKIIGALRLYSDIKCQFPDDVIMMVKALAHQGGIAIQNASMYLQLEKDKKSLEEDIWSSRSWF